MREMRRDERLHYGTRYPTDHLMAIVDNAQGAEQVAQELHDAGFTEVVLFHGQQALQAIEANQRQEGPLRRTWERIWQGPDAEIEWRPYSTALRQGHSVALVYAHQGTQVDRAEGILEAHRAHAIRYFGRWTITDLMS